MIQTPYFVGRCDKRYATPQELWGVLRFEYRHRKAWRSRPAMLRGLWWSFVRRYPCELCESCGLPVGSFVDSTWHADDSLWEEVHGPHGGVLCPPCFTRDARTAGVKLVWRPVRDCQV